MIVAVIAYQSEERDLCAYALKQAGLQVSTFRDATDAVALADKKQIGLFVLWAEEPGYIEDAIAAIRFITVAPILVIGERVTIDQHCRWLESGVDVVFNRPVAMRLVIRYAQNLVRRSNNISLSALSTVTSDVIHLDPGSRSVQVREGPRQHLTQLEFRLLYVLMVNESRVIPVDELVELVWGYNGDGNRDLVRGLVRRLRRKIEPSKEKPMFIQNVPGVGYRFSQEER